MKAALAALLIGVLVLAGCEDAKPRSEARVPKIASGTFPACPPAADQPPANDAMPDVTLGCLDGSGTRYRLASAPGQPTVITLWASWCPPCAKELPAFAALSHSGDVRVLGVVTEDTLSAALNLADDANVDFPNLFDSAGELRRALGRNALPVTLFVAADGTLAYVYNGPALTDETLTSLVKEHLNVDVG